MCSEIAGKAQIDQQASTKVLAASAYAAGTWAFLFAALSFYSAAGGIVGLNTLANSIQQLAQTHNPGFVAIVWATGVLKVLAGVVALALVHPWGRVIPRWLLLTAAWGAGALLVFYGGANLVEFGLMDAGVIGIPTSVGATALRWYLLLWEPWFLIGGFLAAACGFSRRSPVGPA